MSFFLQTSELGVTEHVEGDPCKFALWVGRTPTSDNKIVLKVRPLELGNALCDTFTISVTRVPFPVVETGCRVLLFVPLVAPKLGDHHRKNSKMNPVWYSSGAVS